MIKNNLQFITIFLILLFLRQILTFRKKLAIKYLLTPLITTVTIITALFSLRFNNESTYIYIIIIGLIFSLIGDTMLMIEEKRFFLHGLLFFLFAQTSYTIALAIGYHFKIWNVVTAIILIACISFLYSKISTKAKGNTIPVLVYMLLIATMFYLALAHLNKGFSIQGILVSAGALLFVISDISLAINEFIKTIPNSTVVVWSTYAPAQFLIGLSCYYT